MMVGIVRAEYFEEVRLKDLGAGLGGYVGWWKVDESCSAERRVVDDEALENMVWGSDNLEHVGEGSDL